MKLTNLLQGISSEKKLPDLEIQVITEKASEADESSVFVCIKGARADGHDFAADAYARGCRVFVCERSISLPSDATVISVESARLALANLACELYQNPSHRMRLIGVTGTKGKTTTAQLIAQILNASEIPCGYIGTNGISYGQVKRHTVNTTPDAVTLQATLAGMLKSGVRTAVIEVSSQALMQYRADGTRFETVIFTNLSPDHIGPREHPDFDHYKHSKMRLFSEFGAKNAICNVDDPAFTEMLKDTCATRILTCSTEREDVDFAATEIALSSEKDKLGVSFSLVTQGKSARFCELPMLGTFNASNALLALATAIGVFEIAPSQAVEALKHACVEGRSELVALGRGVAVIDYAHNGVSLSHLLSTLRQYAPRRLIVLFGSVGERSQMRRRELGEVAARLADHAILTSDNPSNEDPNAIIDEIAKAFVGSNTTYEKIPDRREAIEHAVSLLRDGDVLVLAGKGHEEYQLIGDTKIPFSEREILKSAILVSNN